VLVSEPSRAARVSVNSLDVASQTFEQETVTPVVNVQLGYEYDAGQQPVDALRFELSVADSVVASTDLRTSRVALSGDTTLAGRVSDADAWSAQDFTVDIGETVERTVSVGVRMAVLDGDNSVIVEDSVRDDAAITVTHPQENAWTATVGGTGTITDGEQ